MQGSCRTINMMWFQFYFLQKWLLKLKLRFAEDGKYWHFQTGSSSMYKGRGQTDTWRTQGGTCKKRLKSKEGTRPCQALEAHLRILVSPSKNEKPLNSLHVTDKAQGGFNCHSRLPQEQVEEPGLAGVCLKSWNLVLTFKHRLLWSQRPNQELLLGLSSFLCLSPTAFYKVTKKAHPSANTTSTGLLNLA